MTRDKPQYRSVVWSFRFLGTAVAGSIVMAVVSIFGGLSSQLAMLGAFISVLGGLFLSYLGQADDREQERARMIESLSVPLTLASAPELFQRYQEICRSLTSLSQQTDPILHRIAIFKLASVAEQIGGLAAGKAVFALTEAWRTIYEELLRSPDVKQYRSVSLVRTAKYWQDEPGQQSMRVNFQAVQRRVLIERIIILGDALWPHGRVLPSPQILPWIEEQHNHGLWIALVRESELSREPDLLVDMGIYGNRAVGIRGGAKFHC